MSNESIDTHASTTNHPTLEWAWPHVRLGLFLAGIAFWFLVGALAVLLVQGPTQAISIAIVAILIVGTVGSVGLTVGSAAVRYRRRRA